MNNTTNRATISPSHYVNMYVDYISAWQHASPSLVSTSARRLRRLSAKTSTRES
jgi:hypothetical protein